MWGEATPRRRQKLKTRSFPMRSQKSWRSGKPVARYVSCARALRVSVHSSVLLGEPDMDETSALPRLSEKAYPVVLIQAGLEKLESKTSKKVKLAKNEEVEAKAATRQARQERLAVIHR